MPPSLTFKCETITPMLMHGADGTSAELRPASIKGILRFWWRAIHGNLPLEELHEKEGKIFGSTKERSSFTLRVIHNLTQENQKIEALPHKPNVVKLYGFKQDQTFEVIISGQNLNLIQNLFILATTLGGFGQRSRRGFGSVQITNITINGSGASASPKADENKPLFPKTFKDIEELINQTPKFQNLNKQKNEEYPYIQEIKVGKIYDNFEALLTTIGTASHAHDCNELGSANPRLASPIYVSVIQDGSHFRPVITTLKNTQSSKDRNVPNFKKAIL